MLGGCEGGGGWGDGPGPPGVPTGLPCQAPVAAFIIANVLSMTLTIDACRLVGTVQTSCLYWHPEHLPSKPKLTQVLIEEDIAVRRTADGLGESFFGFN